MDAADLTQTPTQRDAVWPLDVVSHQHLPPCAIQSSLLNLGFVSPVRPVHEPETDMQGNSKLGSGVRNLRYYLK